MATCLKNAFSLNINLIKNMNILKVFLLLILHRTRAFVKLCLISYLPIAYHTYLEPNPYILCGCGEE